MGNIPTNGQVAMLNSTAAANYPSGSTYTYIEE